jgi:hypothetical protein
MRDPHVLSLTYRLEHSDSVSFDNPNPIEDERDAFTMRLEDGFVTFTMRDHHPTEEAAWGVVKPYLRAWEISDALRVGRPEVRFKFHGAQLIDRDPPPPRKPGEPISLSVGIATEFNVAGSRTVAHGSYPKPPTEFAVDPDVETLWGRYEGYLDGREPLAAMGYFCLTVVEMRGGGGTLANRPVLRKLGQLTSTAGGRKATGTRPLTGVEQAWVEATVRELIRRAAEVAAGATPPPLMMGDLPPL